MTVMGSNTAVRLVDFVYSLTQAYVLEFGDQTLRIIKNGAYVKLASQTISGITNANPAVATYTGSDTLVAGDQIYLTVVGQQSVFLNGRQFMVGTVDNALNTFTLKYLDGTNVDSTAFGSFTSGSFEEVYTVVSPYTSGMLADIQWAQSADVLTIAHPSVPPKNISRIADDSWTITSVSQDPVTVAPSSIAMPTFTVGATGLAYTVTAVDEDTGQESFMGLGVVKTISGITNANPAVVTYTGADLVNNGLPVYIAGVVGMTEVNGRYFIPANVNNAANTFELQGVDSSAYTAYSSGGTATNCYYAENVTFPTASAPVIITFTTVTGAVEYNVYRANIDGVFGFVGIVRTGRFIDVGYSADTTDTPPERQTLFSASNDYPSTVTYIQQRRAFANSNNDVDTVWTSRIGQYDNFSKSRPLQDDDPIKFRMSGRQVNPVRHLLDLGKLVIFTGSGEWTAEGGDGGLITPTSINLRQYSYSGASKLRPIVAGGLAIYVQANGSIVRDLGFNFESDSYRGNELSIYSSHLVEEYELTDWAYQQTPNSIVWIVRDDGVLLGVTYVREQQMVAWHWHDFQDAIVTNVCVIPEGGEDAVYLSLRRIIDGASVRTIERFVSRYVDVDAPEEMKFMDAHATYDGRNTEPAETMTLTGADYTFGHTLTITSANPFFSASEVGNQIFLTGDDGEVIRFSLVTYGSTTQMTGTADRDVPASLQNDATATWTRAVNEVQGLWHLENQFVSVLGDGTVIGSPNNAAYSQYYITQGTLALGADCYGVIHIGLPYMSDLETLEIDSANSETVADKNKIFTKVSLHMEKTRGVWVGEDAPSDDDDDPLEGLVELKIRNAEGYNDSVTLLTGVEGTIIEGGWQKNGRVFVRQVDPLPMTVLAVMPAGMVPFSKPRGG
jgi:hypothetical protein